MYKNMVVCEQMECVLLAHSLCGLLGRDVRSNPAGGDTSDK